MATQKKAFERLPLDVKPINYVLKLQPDLVKLTFSGSVSIEAQVGKAVKTVVLNAAELNVSEATFCGEGKSLTATIGHDEEDEKVSLTFTEDLPTGSGNLNLVFTGTLNDKMRGFYRSQYKGPDGETRYAAVTQFEATDARRAFPCWDEPAVKATFDVTLVTPADRVTLSNMPVKSETAGEGGLSEVAFERTPVMSTYLLAFVVGEFDYVEGKDSDGVLVRVYTPVGQKGHGEFALEVAVRTLPFYKEYFGIAYPLPKIDLIAIPDFAAGAMENWGLVTYRETALLVDPIQSSSASRQWVALVVGHELAHQWFGNLVTMEWWTHLWLNEGFASWIEYLCVDHCFPEFDIWTQFAHTDFSRFLELDALKSSHPIEVEVGHPSEVDEIFDAISYSKGASVIRMLHNWLGDESYKTGLREYLQAFKYSNGKTEDLWRHLEQASKLPVASVMAAWTKQIGFPLLKVSQRVEGRKRILSLEQERFIADGSSDDAGLVWPIPVQVSTEADPTGVAHTQLVTSKTTEIVLNDVDPNHWVKLNPGTVGCYRVQYSSDLLTALTKPLKNLTLPPRDRLGVYSDLFALASAGKISLVEFFKVVQAATEEDNFTVWSDLSTYLECSRKLCQNMEGEQQMLTFCQGLYRPVFGRLGWEAQEGESPLKAMLRGLVVGWLGKTGCPDTVQEARARFKAHVAGDKQIPADLRVALYTTVLRSAGDEVFDDFMKLLKSADIHEERVRIMRSLGAVTNPDLIQRVLDFSLSDEVRSQDAMFVMGGCVSSKKGRELTFQFLKDKFDTLAERFKGLFMLGRMIKIACSDFACDKAADEMEEFFKKNPVPNAERSISQAVESVRLNAACLKRDREALQKFFAENA